MRIVLDFQACQSDSRYRGVGRGSHSLMLAMGSRFVARGHEVICLFNDAFQAGLNELRAGIIDQIPRVRLATFRIPSPCAAAWPENSWRQMAARILREYAIACLEPDFVHVPALLADGWGDDSVGSVGELGIPVPVSLTQHDLIPLTMQNTYMSSDDFRDYYMKKLEGVKKAQLLMAISEYSRKEAIDLLELSEKRVVNISSAADSLFLRRRPDTNEINAVMDRYEIRHGFLFYVPGGFDPRKNLNRLIRAYALLPAEVRTRHQLVIASKLDPGRLEELNQFARILGVSTAEFVLTDYILDEDLLCLYRACHAYVFPSLHEGFGLPVLEAMACGAPVIASNCTSIPEVVGMDEALFDPYCEEAIAKKMHQVIEDKEFRCRLQNHAVQQPDKFSWERSAKAAVIAIEEQHEKLMKDGWHSTSRKELPTCDELLERLQQTVQGVVPSKEDLALFRACYMANSRGDLV